VLINLSKQAATSYVKILDFVSCLSSSHCSVCI